MSADLRNPGTSADPRNAAALPNTPRPNRASTITPEQERAIADLLAKIPHLAKGIGTMEAPCSVAAINRALRGRFTDAIPKCMSLVIGGRWRAALLPRQRTRLVRVDAE